MSVRTPGQRSRYTALAVVAVACLVLLSYALSTASTLTAPLLAVADAVSRLTSEAGGLFVRAGPELWLQPAAVYPSAALMRIGFSEALALRLPAALAGVLTIVVTFMLTTRITGDRATAAAAAALLLVMPGFRAYAARPGAELLMVPLVMAWVTACVAYRTRPRLWLIISGGVALGACAYTQPAGVLAVPVFFVVGAFLLWRGPRPMAALGSAAIATAATQIPAVLWVGEHLQAYADTFGRWAIHAAHVRDPIDGVIAFTRWHVMGRRVGDYWQYFNPTFLFSTELFGVLFALLLPIGLWGLRSASRGGAALLIACALLIPIPAVLLDVQRSAGFVLLLLPIGAVISAVGLLRLRELTHPGNDVQIMNATSPPQ